MKFAFQTYLLSLYLQFLEQATGIFSCYESFCELDEGLSYSTPNVNKTTKKQNCEYYYILEYDVVYFGCEGRKIMRNSGFLRVFAKIANSDY
jgi:hypothetical protein